MERHVPSNARKQTGNRCISIFCEVLRLRLSEVYEVGEVMETDSVRLESSVWLGNKRHRALLSGWRFSWTELDKKNRDKTTSKY